MPYLVRLLDNASREVREFATAGLGAFALNERVGNATREFIHFGPFLRNSWAAAGARREAGRFRVELARYMASHSNHRDVLQRATAVLDVLADSPGGISFEEIATAAGFGKSSCRRILESWEALGFAAGSDSGEFRPGPAAVALARKLGRRDRVVEASRKVLERVQQATGESVHLAVYRGGRVVLVDGVESGQAVRVVFAAGEECPLYASAMGRAVAAFLDPARLDGLLEESGGLRPLTPHTSTSRDVLRRRLQQCRSTGHSINWEEMVEGAVCVGVPYFSGVEGAVLGALGVSIPVFRAKEEYVRQCVETAVGACQELSVLMAGVAAEPEAMGREPLVR